MPSTKEKILEQKRRYYPTGRAFRMQEGNNMYALHSGLAVSEVQSYEDSMAIMYSILPDNGFFTSDDATDWERRLGLITNLSTPLADREAAIRRKMAAPGVQPAHGHYLYLERQLQAAGFNVWVHENLFYTYPTGYESVPPNTLYGNTYFKTARHGMFNHGQRLHGGYYTNKIANSIYQEEDNNFQLGGSFASTFFIGGQTIGTYANVLAVREVEFRQLILQIKQVQSIGFLQINYI